MASHNAISVVSQAILDLLRYADTPSEFNTLEYKHYDANDFLAPIPRGFSLYLWRVSISQSRRNLPPRRLADGRVFRPSLPLDLHYLLTPWADDAETQQRMLGWAMRVIEDVTIIPASVLNFGPSEINTFAAQEAVELICDPLALNDHFNLWDKLKTRMQTSMTYQARNILIDSQRTVTEGDLVQTRVFHAPSAVP